MQFELEITRKAEKDFKNISAKDLGRIHSAIMALRSGLHGDVKKLADHIPEYRLRVGDWRVLFSIEQYTIVIARVLNRKDAYRK